MGLVGQGGEVGVAAGPLDGIPRGVGVAGVPEAEVQAGRGLRVLVVGGVAVAGGVQRAQHGAVERPGQGVGRPVKRVGVEAVRQVGRHARLRAAVPAAGHALAVVVGLHGRAAAVGAEREVVARPLPVDLVQRVGHEHGRRDYAYAGRRLQHHVDAAEE